ncbi:MAG: DNA internalization-related competence protein ComEC/Rec2 [Desulfuromusa sp.]|jgi:competence protein ComEC|nr:DNA internalization-related competence protein ComEC/Rec2 [Desulfuromusa sp.]
MQPLLIALSATAGALLLTPLYTFSFSFSWIFTILLGLLYLLLCKHTRIAAVLLFLCFFIFSSFHYSHLFSIRPDIISIDQLAKKVTLTGSVTDIRQLTEGRSWIELLVDSVALKGQQLPLEGPLRVRLYLGEGTDQLFPGDMISCNSRLRKPRLFGTPGEFHWPRYMASQHLDMTAWVKNAEKIEVIGRSGGFPGRMVVQWRNAIATTIQNMLPENRAYLVRALVLGEGRIIPDDIRRTLAKSGISHLFAISGLHLGMIALLGYRFLLSLYRHFPRLLNWHPPQRVLPLVLLPLLLAYMLLTGDAVSTRRAFSLAALGAVFLCWRYYVNPLMLLASLALISLLVNPLLFWQAGWQLSFAGAAGILFWRPLWQTMGSNHALFLRYPLQLLLVTLAAMVATLPLVLLDFHLFAPVSVLANLVSVPVVTLFALPVGLLGLISHPVYPPLAGIFFQLCGLLLEFVLSLADWFASLPGLGGTYHFLSSFQYLAVGIGSLPLLLFPILSRKTLSQVVVTCLLFAVTLWQFPLAQTAPASLTMFSVGQGESMLLRNNAGQAILIDGGGFYSDRFDVGERLLAPAFAELGVTELSAVVLTHDDLDHRKGLVFILNHFPVGEFLSGLPLSELHHSLQAVLLAKRIPVKIIPAGWSYLSSWSVGSLQVFNGMVAGSNKNDSSLVMLLNIADHDGLLLTGDLGQEGVHKLLREGVPGPVSLLKLPHHGSGFSAADLLIDQLQPENCLVSVGYQNRYHLPASQVVGYLQQRNIPLHRTDLSGSLQAQFVDNAWQVKHWCHWLFR